MSTECHDDRLRRWKAEYEKNDRPRQRERGDYEDRYSPERPACPSGVNTAGLIWLVIGVMILGVSIPSLILNVMVGGSGVMGAVFGLVFGWVFYSTGKQTRSGKAKGSLGNGVFSLVCGVLAGGGGLLIAAFAVLSPDGVVGAVLLGLAAIYLLAGVALLMAGVQAIGGRSEYKAWRKWNERQGR